MSSQFEINKQSLDGFFELLQSQKEDADWAAKLQFHCETFWGHLDNAKDDITPSQEVLDAFIKILQKQHAFSIASLVIPEFRSESAIKLENLQKQYVMEKTAHLRVVQCRKNTRTPMQFNDPLYRDEQEIFAEAEMFRVEVALYGQGDYSEMEREKLRIWWEAMPGRKKAEERDEMKDMTDMADMAETKEDDTVIGDMRDARMENEGMEGVVDEERDGRGVKRQRAH